jgi:hypothetical protein
MLIGAIDDVAIDDVAIDSAAIDAGAMLSGAIVVGAIDAATLAVIEAAALDAAALPGVRVAAGELLLPLLHAEATNRPVRASAPTEVNLIQGLLQVTAGQRDVCALTDLCAEKPETVYRLTLQTRYGRLTRKPAPDFLGTAGSDALDVEV